MAQKTYFDKTMSHYTSKPWGKKSNDRWTINIPPRYKHVSTTLKILESHSGGGARLVQKPVKNQTGQAVVEVHWWYNAFGKIRFRVYCNAEKIAGASEPLTQIIKSTKRTHFSPVGFTGDKGTDTIVVDIPSGYTFKSAKIVYTNKNGGGARISSQPPRGSTGSLPFNVHWWYDPFGKVSYYIQVTAVNIPGPELEIEDFTYAPDPAVAGTDLNCQLTVKNTGTITIGDVQVRAIISGSRHGFDIPPSEVYNEVHTLDLNAGRQKIEGVTVSVPPHYNGYSTAGEYTLVVVIETLDGISLDSWKDDHFMIVEP